MLRLTLARSWRHVTDLTNRGTLPLASWRQRLTHIDVAVQHYFTSNLELVMFSWLAAVLNEFSCSEFEVACVLTSLPDLVTCQCSWRLLPRSRLLLGSTWCVCVGGLWSYSRPSTRLSTTVDVARSTSVRWIEVWSPCLPCKALRTIWSSVSEFISS